MRSATNWRRIVWVPVPWSTVGLSTVSVPSASAVRVMPVSPPEMWRP